MKKKVKRFDVWVTRNHWRNNQIRVSNTTTTDITRSPGCTVFNRVGRAYGQDISNVVCLKRYGFLPQPATCWNVWTDAKGVIRYQEYPILERDRGSSYEAKPLKSEQEFYL